MILNDASRKNLETFYSITATKKKEKETRKSVELYHGMHVYSGLKQKLSGRNTQEHFHQIAGIHQ